MTHLSSFTPSSTVHFGDYRRSRAEPDSVVLWDILEAALPRAMDIWNSDKPSSHATTIPKLMAALEDFCRSDMVQKMFDAHEHEELQSLIHSFTTSTQTEALWLPAFRSVVTFRKSSIGSSSPFLRAHGLAPVTAEHQFLASHDQSATSFSWLCADQLFPLRAADAVAVSRQHQPLHTVQSRIFRVVLPPETVSAAAAFELVMDSVRSQFREDSKAELQTRRLVYCPSTIQTTLSSMTSAASSPSQVLSTLGGPKQPRGLLYVASSPTVVTSPTAVGSRMPEETSLSELGAHAHFAIRGAHWALFVHMLAKHFSQHASEPMLFLRVYVGFVMRQVFCSQFSQDLLQAATKSDETKEVKTERVDLSRFFSLCALSVRSFVDSTRPALTERVHNTLVVLWNEFMVRCADLCVGSPCSAVCADASSTKLQLKIAIAQLQTDETSQPSVPPGTSAEPTSSNVEAVLPRRGLPEHALDPEWSRAFRNLHGLFNEGSVVDCVIDRALPVLSVFEMQSFLLLGHLKTVTKSSGALLIADLRRSNPDDLQTLSALFMEYVTITDLVLLHLSNHVTTSQVPCAWINLRQLQSRHRLTICCLATVADAATRMRRHRRRFTFLPLQPMIHFLQEQAFETSPQANDARTCVSRHLTSLEASQYRYVWHHLKEFSVALTSKSDDFNESNETLNQQIESDLIAFDEKQHSEFLKTQRAVESLHGALKTLRCNHDLHSNDMTHARESKNCAKCVKSEKLEALQRKTFEPVRDPFIDDALVTMLCLPKKFHTIIGVSVELAFRLCTSIMCARHAPMSPIDVLERRKRDWLTSLSQETINSLKDGETPGVLFDFGDCCAQKIKFFEWKQKPRKVQPNRLAVPSFLVRESGETISLQRPFELRPYAVFAGNATKGPFQELLLTEPQLPTVDRGTKRHNRSYVTVATEATAAQRVLSPLQWQFVLDIRSFGWSQHGNLIRCIVGGAVPGRAFLSTISAENDDISLLRDLCSALSDAAGHAIGRGSADHEAVQCVYLNDAIAIARATDIRDCMSLFLLSIAFAPNTDVVKTCIIRAAQLTQRATDEAKRSGCHNLWIAIARVVTVGLACFSFLTSLTAETLRSFITLTTARRTAMRLTNAAPADFLIQSLRLNVAVAVENVAAIQLPRFWSDCEAVCGEAFESFTKATFGNLLTNGHGARKVTWDAATRSLTYFAVTGEPAFAWVADAGLWYIAGIANEAGIPEDVERLSVFKSVFARNPGLWYDLVRDQHQRRYRTASSLNADALYKEVPLARSEASELDRHAAASCYRDDVTLAVEFDSHEGVAFVTESRETLATVQIRVCVAKTCRVQGRLYWVWSATVLATGVIVEIYWPVADCIPLLPGVGISPRIETGAHYISTPSSSVMYVVPLELRKSPLCLWLPEIVADDFCVPRQWKMVSRCKDVPRELSTIENDCDWISEIIAHDHGFVSLDFFDLMFQRVNDDSRQGHLLRWHTDPDYVVVSESEQTGEWPAFLWARNRCLQMRLQPSRDKHSDPMKPRRLLLIASPSACRAIQERKHITVLLSDHSQRTIRLWTHPHLRNIQSNSPLLAAELLSEQDNGIEMYRMPSGRCIVGEIISLLRASSLLHPRTEHFAADYEALERLVLNVSHPSVILMAGCLLSTMEQRSDAVVEGCMAGNNGADRRAQTMRLALDAYQHLLECGGQALKTLSSDILLTNEELSTATGAHCDIARFHNLSCLENCILSNKITAQYHSLVDNVKHLIREGRDGVVQALGLNAESPLSANSDSPSASTIPFPWLNDIFPSLDSFENVRNASMAIGLRDRIRSRMEASFKAALQTSLTVDLFNRASELTTLQACQTAVSLHLNRMEELKTGLVSIVDRFSFRGLLQSSLSADVIPATGSHLSLMTPLHIGDVGWVLLAAARCPDNAFACTFSDHLSHTGNSKSTFLGVCRALLVAWAECDHCERMLFHIHAACLGDHQKDMHIAAILREITSPREDIERRDHWVAFEVEQRIRIRRAQFATWQQMSSVEHRATPLSMTSQMITQLNMGEGKTRVIVPMILLDKFFGNSAPSMCVVHLLSSVLHECAEYFSETLQTPSFRFVVINFCFSREFRASDSDAVIRMHATFARSPRQLVVTSRDAFVSHTLKREEALLAIDGSGEPTTEKAILSHFCSDMGSFNALVSQCGNGATAITHIYDEADALLSADYSMVYAVGSRQPLPWACERAAIIGCVLWHVASVAKVRLAAFPNEERLTSESSIFHRTSMSTHGSFPGFYLVVDPDNPTATKQVAEFLQDILLSLLDRKHHQQTPAALFPLCDLAASSDVMRNHVILVATGFVISDAALPKEATSCAIGEAWAAINRRLSGIEGQQDAMALMCGLFRGGVLVHALCGRPQETYGTPPKHRATSLAVPYVAADVPSERSEFAHPDVAITFTFLSYLHRGLTLAHFTDAVKALLRLPVNSRLRVAQSWSASHCRTHDELVELGLEFIHRQLVDLDTSNQNLIVALHRALWDCIPLITFWVQKCVVEVEACVYPMTLTATAWDIVSQAGGVSKEYQGNACGFSGTVDACHLVPTDVIFEPHPEPSVQSATAEMISKVASHTLGCVTVIPFSSSSRTHGASSLATLKHAMTLGCSVIIDIGAFFAGQSLSDVARQAVGMLSTVEEGRYEFCKGVVYYCSEEASWMVMDRTSRSQVALSESALKPHMCFVIYDQARCRGADLKLAADAVALVTLGPSTTKDLLLQGVGRLRHFGRNQSIRLVTSPPVARTIIQVAAIDASLPTINARDVLRWATRNSIQLHSSQLRAFYESAHRHRAKLQHLTAENRLVTVSPSSLPSDMYSTGATERVSLVSIVESLFSDQRMHAPLLAHARSLARDFMVDKRAADSLSGNQEREIVQQSETHTERETIAELKRLAPRLGRSDPELLRLVSDVASRNLTAAEFEKEARAAALVDISEAYGLSSRAPCLRVPKRVLVTEDFQKVAVESQTELMRVVRFMIFVATPDKLTTSPDKTFWNVIWLSEYEFISLFHTMEDETRDSVLSAALPSIFQGIAIMYCFPSMWSQRKTELQSIWNVHNCKAVREHIFFAMLFNGSAFSATVWFESQLLRTSRRGKQECFLFTLPRTPQAAGTTERQLHDSASYFLRKRQMESTYEGSSLQRILRQLVCVQDL